MKWRSQNLLRIAGLPILAAGALLAHAQEAAAESASFDMREDWRTFFQLLQEMHRNPFYHTPRDVFLAEQETFLRDAPQMTRGQQIVEFAKLVALVGDGHTWLPMHQTPFDGLPPGPEFHALPVRFELFDDGLFIVGAVQEYANLVGAKVVRIGDMTTDLALQRVMTTLPTDAVNFSREMAPEWLMLAEVLVALGITGDTTGVEVGVLKEHVVHTATIKPISSDRQYDWIFSMDTGPASSTRWTRASKKTPLWREPITSPFRTQKVGQRIQYFQINQVRNDRDRTLEDAAASIANSKPSAVIIDLRNCIGGDGSLIPDVMTELTKLDESKPIVVLTSRKTHSASVMFVSALEQQTNAVFIGQATADRPNHFGETNIFVLPDSQLPVLYASEYYQTSAADDVRPFRSPDIPVPYLYEDYVRGYDRTLETALAYLKRK